MNVSLTPELEQFVKKEVDGGLYQTASEVVRAGLRRLKEDQQARSPRTPRTLAELEADLLRAAESFDAGKGADAAEVFARLRKRVKTTRTNA